MIDTREFPERPRNFRKFTRILWWFWNAANAFEKYTGGTSTPESVCQLEDLLAGLR
jgi:hypothetical protein